MNIVEQIALDRKPIMRQIIFFLGIFLACYLLASSIMMLVLMMTGLGIEGFQNIDAATITDSEISTLKFVQIISALCLFILPALIFSWFKSGNGKAAEYLKMNQAIDPKIGLFAALVMITSIPLTAFLLQFNMGLSLPESMASIEAWMREMETQAGDLTAVFLNMPTIGSLLVNMLMIAIIPAIGEELLFRGVLQQLLQEWLKKPHLAIFISAVVFSAFHFQFFGFLPRCLLGLFLGYLFYWSGNLWYPIIGHFVNNGFQVLLAYAGLIETSETEMPEAIPLHFVLGGTLVMCSCLYLFHISAWGGKRNRELASANQTEQ